MDRSSIPTDSKDGANKPLYERSFVARALEIVQMGYEQLESGQFANSEEEDITGELQRAMAAWLEAPDAPRWAPNFSANEEVRIHDQSRTGKRRRRIDIEITRHKRGPRPRFRFEAKRLHSTTTHKSYIGDEGLGCFLDGRYAENDGAAGMIGYVQRGQLTHHAEQLRTAVTQGRTNLRVTDDGDWSTSDICPCCPCYRTQHFKHDGTSRIDVFHTLLQFYPSEDSAVAT